MVRRERRERLSRFQWQRGVIVMGIVMLTGMNFSLPLPLLLILLVLPVLALVGWRFSFGSLLDSSDTQAADDRQRECELRFRALLESLPKVAVQGYDKHRRVIYWNEASTRLYGYRRDEATGRLLEDLLIPDAMRDEVIARHRTWLNEGKEIEAEELELKHKSGRLVSVFSHHVMLGQGTADPLLFCVDVDLSDEKQALRHLDFATRFDALTHLPNRQHFEAELDRQLAEIRHRRECLSVIYIDIDQFAEINDTQGYGMGDALLILVAKRLCESRPGVGLLSRFGGDEFVMAFPRLATADDALALIEDLFGTFQQPFMIGGQELHVTISAGISLYPDNGAKACELIRNADVAKNRAKQAGRNSYCFFNPQFHDELIRQHRLMERLQVALREGEFELHYQPQVAARSGRVESFEALLRWFPKQGDAVSTAECIQLAERGNLIHRLGDWVMHEACRQQAQWKAQGLGGYRVDINLSGKQIAQEGVFQRLEGYMTQYGLTARDIGIELTENVLIHADPKVLEGLRRLYHQGMKIALDDFGTGYSSLSYLKVFPVTSIKIDRAFIRDAPSVPSDRVILEAAVFIGHRLGLEVIAEGVEDEVQLELAREMGCDLIQGYCFFKPMTHLDAAKLMAERA